MIIIWRKPASPLQLSWRGPDLTLYPIVDLTQAMPQIPTVIGPPGPRGGPAETNEFDPGDLLVYFENALI